MARKKDFERTIIAGLSTAAGKANKSIYQTRVQAANFARVPLAPKTMNYAARALGGYAAGAALLGGVAINKLNKYAKTSGPGRQMAKYKAKGGFSHMTSNPSKRGKEGVDY